MDFNEYQEKAANVLVQFQALQGNAIDPSVTSASELQEKLNLNTKIPLIDWSSDNTSIKRRVFFTLKP